MSYSPIQKYFFGRFDLIGSLMALPQTTDDALSTFHASLQPSATFLPNHGTLYEHNIQNPLHAPVTHSPMDVRWVINNTVESRRGGARVPVPHMQLATPLPDIECSCCCSGDVRRTQLSRIGEAGSASAVRISARPGQVEGPRFVAGQLHPCRHGSRGTANQHHPVRLRCVLVQQSVAHTAQIADVRWKHLIDLMWKY